MTEPQEKQVDASRDDHGRLLPGHTANPYGRPKGTSITEAVRAELMKYPEGSKATYLQMIVLRIFKKAIEEGDNVMLKAIWNYMDGLPKQSIDMTASGFLTMAQAKIENLNENDIRELRRIAESATDKPGTGTPTPA